ncbi:hypothetical protein HY480_03110, partial [Candidatus Uhrbacteria bacterium]|nr:hypothetical protein [Candidatus Uhrbacteria bacterium]
GVTGLKHIDVLGGYFIAIVMIGVAIVTTFVMTVIMTFRIVMLWILIVLSPAPYVLGLIPQGKKYADQWWQMFGQYLVVGPVLAFFLWLALVSVGTGAASSEFPAPAGSESDAAAAGLSVGKTNAGSKESMLSFLIAIAMLVGGLKIAGDMGVAGAGMAKGAAEKMGKVARGAAYKLSGARAVSERWGAFQKMREAGREDKVKASASRIAGAYGAVLAAPGKGIGKLVSMAPGALTPFQHRAQEAREAARQARASGDIAKAEQQEARARRFDRLSKGSGVAWKAGMVAAAPATGGASLIGLIPAGIRQMGRAGAAAQKKAKQYKYDDVTKALAAMKDTKPADVTGKIYDGTATSTDRMAAFLKATQDGLLKTEEVEKGEEFLKGLGADEKTMNTFKSYAEQGHYAGTMLTGNRAERQKRIAGGWMPTKDLHPEELTRDQGSLVADFVLKGNEDQRKELRKSRAHGAAYKTGVKGAVGTAQAALTGFTPGSPERRQAEEDLQKLQTELMQLGTDTNEKAAGKSAFEVSGMNLATLGNALQTVAAPGLLANIEQKDLGTVDFLKTIVQNVKGSHFRAGRGAAQKDNDPAKIQAFTALENAIKNSQRFKDHEREQATVRGATANVGNARKAFDKASALLATDPNNTTNQIDHALREDDLKDAEKQLKQAQTAFEKEMDKKGIAASERELYESMKSKRK